MLKLCIFLSMLVPDIIHGSLSEDDEEKVNHQSTEYSPSTSYLSSPEYEQWLQQYYNFYYGHYSNYSRSYYNQHYQQPQGSYPLSYQHHPGPYQYLPSRTEKPIDYYSLLARDDEDDDEPDQESEASIQPSSSQPDYYTYYYPQTYHHQYHPQSYQQYPQSYQNLQTVTESPQEEFEHKRQKLNYLYQQRCFARYQYWYS